MEVTLTKRTRYAPIFQEIITVYEKLAQQLSSSFLKVPMTPNTILHNIYILDIVNSQIPNFYLIQPLCQCFVKTFFAQMIMSLMLFKTLFVYNILLLEKSRNSNEMVYLNLILDILSTFPLKYSFSLLKEKQEKNFQLRK